MIFGDFNNYVLIQPCMFSTHECCHCVLAALSDENEMFLINGNYRLDLPAEYPYAGTTFNYSRGVGGVEQITASGPTSIDIYVKVT